MKLINTSEIPDAVVRRMIEFIGRRLPVDCEVRIVQGSGWGSGRAWGARRARVPGVRRPVVRGGRVFVRAPSSGFERAVLRSEGRGGYLPRVYYGAEERFFAVLAHEIRHVFQGVEPLVRESRRVRRHRLGTSGKLREVDACLFETRTLRRFRREWGLDKSAAAPIPSPQRERGEG